MWSGQSARYDDYGDLNVELHRLLLEMFVAPPYILVISCSSSLDVILSFMGSAALNSCALCPNLSPKLPISDIDFHHDSV